MKPRLTPNGFQRFRHHSVLPRFTDAFRGIYMAYREEPNLRFHVFAGACAVVAAVAVSLAPWEAAYLTATVFAVIFAEMVNTAVERAVDFAAAGQRHPLAGQAKEVAAGAVLVTAVHAVFAAGLLFLYNRGITETVGALWQLALERPWWALLPAAAGVLGVFGGVREPHG
ncbi:MAG TPA: diacylglycerol kinase family protein [Symbiobacteriaceae bacterium]|nr:diacylglycerol kinase family protein [Symbiobacteriaceae bacterium]